MAVRDTTEEGNVGSVCDGLTIEWLVSETMGEGDV